MKPHFTHNTWAIRQLALLTSLLWIYVISSISATTLSLTPVYTHTAGDYTWTDNSGTNFTVPTVASDYDNEVWERPVESGKWSDSGGTRTATGEYYSYIDIESAGMGWDSNYLYAKITVVGDYKQIGSSKSSEGYLGQYYIYFSPSDKGTDGYVMALTAGKDAPTGSQYTNDSPITSKFYHDTDGDVGGSALTTTFDDNPNEAVLSDGFDTEVKDGSASPVYIRRDGNTMHFALKLSVIGEINPAYLETLDFIRFGVAKSNPSSPDGDLLANDEFTEAQSGDTTYDTVGLGLVPEPTAVILLVLGTILVIPHRSRRR